MGQPYGFLMSALVLIAGVLIASNLECITPHEHGGADCSCGHDCGTRLENVGFITMIGVALHSFPEGIATFMASYENLGVGLSIAAATALHHIPVGLSVALAVFAASKSRAKAFRYTLLACIPGPVGALVALLFIGNISAMLTGVIFSLIAGIMLFIGVGELLPASKIKGYGKESGVSLFAGVFLMLIIRAFST
jgi:ZIP family zinc transporter